MSARALCSVLFVALGVYFIAEAVTTVPFLASQINSMRAFTAGPNVDPQQTAQMTGGWLLGGVGIVWELVVGVALIAFRDRVAIRFIPQDVADDTDDNADADAADIQAVGLTLVGVYLMAAALPQITTDALRSFNESSSQFVDSAQVASHVVQVAVGAILVFWGQGGGARIARFWRTGG